MFDKVLTIPQPEHIGQTTGWFCGPATCQTTLQILGDFYEEEQLANEMGTTQDGTNHIGLLANCLNSHAHHAQWEAVFIENDPMTAEQKEQFWTHLTASLSAGFPCPMNWVAPPGGTPIAVDPNTGQPTAEQPGYSNSYTTFHYVLARGAVENNLGRFVAVCDSGFWPQQYYIKFDGGAGGSACTLIPPKGYVWASAAPIGVPTLPGPAPAPTTNSRFWPVTADRFVTSPFGPRDGGFHSGVDFGFHGGSGDRPVFAIQSGTVQFSGPAQGYGGPDPAGWIVIDSDDSQGSGVFEYGHVVRLPHIAVGVTVNAGDQIATINPDSATNGGVAPHLHLSYMPRGYDPAAKMDPLPLLDGAAEPAVISAPPQHHLPEDPAAMIVNHHPQPAPAPTPAPQQQTCLTGRPHHHSENPPPDELLLDMRAEGLCTQALVYAIAEKLGLDAAGIYQSARDSF
jgi:hypothetical protein